ncbi:right-handed parallel beta-helix repeat-containing protein [Thiocapsa bogorovii]|uniref:right-handed parallel beta-helix repeat-containing protein n=1 Tax=Thiocapsa bogorovii TaxID=521689 RepID=UPI001E2A8D6C|nr:right-handed parallel beta-helix repeat-containing protein [Thiocapsa bogorovii]UHD14840.1 hypothetical protein LT988_16285 [Thiocapsa bogorovii]
MFDRLLFALLLLPTGSFGADYYLSAAGRDTNSGSSSQAPWRSLNKINDLILDPGDRVFLRGGDNFSGSLFFDAFDRGTAASPIRIGSYGTGRATILAGDGDGILAYNTAGFVISNLNLRGSGADVNDGAGIIFYTDLPGGVKLKGVTLNKIDASGFHHAGVEIGAWNGTAGFTNVSIDRVRAYDNARNGINVWGYDAPGFKGYAHAKVYITGSFAYRNPGVSGVREPTGNGIVMSNVDGGRIARCVAHSNGERNTSSSGPIGIWAWRTNRITIQFSESYGNRTTSGAADGGGFDLDGGVTNSTLQYTYSHDNDGAGYLFAQYDSAPSFKNNVIRYNISENDGRRNRSGGIVVWSKAPLEISNSHIYNNTIYLSPSPTGNVCGIRVASQTSSLSIRNNIISTTSGAPLLCVAGGQKGLAIQGNNYWSNGSPFKIYWGPTRYSSLSAFRVTGQETLNGVSTGLAVDPGLVNPGLGGTIGNPNRLNKMLDYRLKTNSPLVNRGIDLKALLGLSTGTRDFYGTGLPQRGAYDIGAHELAY